MRVAIMQPYLLPYIGYWQLLHSADQFVLYDNIQFTKKGWINRNRYLTHGDWKYFTLPVAKDSDYLWVNQRTVADSFDSDKVIRNLSEAYRKAPQYDRVMPMIETIFRCGSANLFDFIYHAIKQVTALLGIDTPIVVSSSLDVDVQLKGQDRVLATCEIMGTDEYVNPIGGVTLYQDEAFNTRNIKLRFLESHPICYPQFSQEFVPWLSIIDLMMFNDKDELNKMINAYTIRGSHELR